MRQRLTRGQRVQLSVKRTIAPLGGDLGIGHFETSSNSNSTPESCHLGRDDESVRTGGNVRALQHPVSHLLRRPVRVRGCKRPASANRTPTANTPSITRVEVVKSFFASLLPSGHFLHHCCLLKCRYNPGQLRLI